jgi:ABC-type sulfate/molybdate transport systems ATPase subunit
MFTRYVSLPFMRARLHKYVGGETSLVQYKAEIWLYTCGGSIRGRCVQIREAFWTQPKHFNTPDFWNNPLEFTLKCQHSSTTIQQRKRKCETHNSHTQQIPVTVRPLQVREREKHDALPHRLNEMPWLSWQTTPTRLSWGTGKTSGLRLTSGQRTRQLQTFP